MLYLHRVQVQRREEEADLLDRVFPSGKSKGKRRLRRTRRQWDTTKVISVG